MSDKVKLPQADVQTEVLRHRKGKGSGIKELVELVEVMLSDAEDGRNYGIGSNLCVVCTDYLDQLEALVEELKHLIDGDEWYIKEVKDFTSGPSIETGHIVGQGDSNIKSQVKTGKNNP